MNATETFKTFTPYASSAGRRPSPAAVRLSGGSLRFNTNASLAMLEYFGDTEVSIEVGILGTVQLVPVAEEERGRKLTLNKRTGTVSLSVRGLDEQILDDSSYPLDVMPEAQGFSFAGSIPA